MILYSYAEQIFAQLYKSQQVWNMNIFFSLSKDLTGAVQKRKNSPLLEQVPVMTITYRLG